MVDGVPSFGSYEHECDDVGPFMLVLGKKELWELDCHMRCQTILCIVMCNHWLQLVKMQEVKDTLFASELRRDMSNLLWDIYTFHADDFANLSLCFLHS